MFLRTVAELESFKQLLVMWLATYWAGKNKQKSLKLPHSFNETKREMVVHKYQQ